MAKQKILNILICIVVTITVICFSSFNFFNSLDIKEQKTITFWTLQLGSFDKYINNIISEYEKENQNVKIKWIDVPYSEGEKRTLAAILTDNPPDLVNLTPDFSLLLAQKNALYTIEEEKLSSFLPSLTQTLKYNDKYFGIPFYATSAVTLYNKDLTNKLKLKELPKTYDDLFAISYKNNPFYLTMINFAENDTLLKLLNKYNINSPSTINNEQSIRLFYEFKDMYASGRVPKESITQTHRDSLEKYMSGQLVFLVTGANFINMIKENAPSVYKNTGVIPQLTGDTGLYDYSLMNFIIPKKSKNPEIALDFALYFTNKTNQLEFAKMTPILPVNKEALEDEYFKADSANIEVQARKISAEQLNNLQSPLQNIKNKKELNNLSSNYIQQILIKNIPIENALNKFSDDWKKL